jgi:hypothetical protein
LRTVKNNSGTDTDLFLFVSANSEYKNWDSAKKQRYDYILGLYRTVLQSNGVEDTIENPINLFLIPIYFDKGKFDELKIETSVTHRNSETTNSGLDKNGVITKELKRFV